MRPSEEVAQIDEFAVCVVLDVDDAPPILAATNLPASNVDGFFTTDDGERDDILDLSVDSALIIIMLLVFVWIHSQVVESEFFLYALLKCASFFQC